MRQKRDDKELWMVEASYHAWIVCRLCCYMEEINDWNPLQLEKTGGWKVFAMYA